jgi:hypothetical protein
VDWRVVEERAALAAARALEAALVAAAVAVHGVAVVALLARVQDAVSAARAKRSAGMQAARAVAEGRLAVQTAYDKAAVLGGVDDRLVGNTGGRRASRWREELREAVFRAAARPLLFAVAAAAVAAVRVAVVALLGEFHDAVATYTRQRSCGRHAGRRHR